MFILFAIPVGIVLGLIAGGRLESLGSIQFRFGPLVLAGLAVQVVLFSPLANGLPAEAGRAIYVLSTAAVFVAVVANLRLTGVPLVVLGAAANLVAILANGGAMPADPAALAAAGIDPVGGANSVVLAEPALRPLTDVFALPAWLPLANVFSLGDVLIGLGVAIAIAAAMGERPGPADAGGIVAASPPTNADARPPTDADTRPAMDVDAPGAQPPGGIGD